MSEAKGMVKIMKHKGSILIETPRLILRKFEKKDILNVFNNITSDDKVTQFMTWQTHKNIVATEELVNLWLSRYDDESYYRWAIVLKETVELIGVVTVVNMDERAESLEIGYYIGSKWWNGGLTTEAVKSIIHFLFSEVKVGRIEACINVINKQSCRVLEKCGFMFEGIMRKALWDNNGISDKAVYSIISDDYFLN